MNESKGAAEISGILYCRVGSGKSQFSLITALYQIQMILVKKNACISEIETFNYILNQI